MSTYLPRSFRAFNDFGGPFKYQEDLPVSFRRADFADAPAHIKPSFFRKTKPYEDTETPIEGSPTKTYSSFDSLSVLLEHIPQDLPKAGIAGVGWKGDFEYLDRNLAGPAYLLANLIPETAYIFAPSTEIIHAFLSRAYDVPLFIITVAACMLKSLSPEAFAKVWHATCPLTITFQPDSTGPFGSCSRDGKTIHLHDLPPEHRQVSPEIIVLAALALADVFSPDDRDHDDKWWVMKVAHSRYTQAQFNATKRCILHDLDYVLMPLTEKSINRVMVREMAKWQHKLTAIEVEQIMRDLGTWDTPPPPASGETASHLSKYQQPAVISVASSSPASTSLPIPTPPSTSLASTSLPSTSLPSTSTASISAAVAPLTLANLQLHQAGLRAEYAEAHKGT